MDKQENSSIQNFDFDIINKKVIITRCDTSATEVVIPSEIMGYPVTKIGIGAFFICKKLKSVTIPSSVKIIEQDAFNKCISLTSITIPNTVEIIRKRAFAYCENLESIQLSQSIIILEEATFRECKKLKSISIILFLK